MNTYQLEARKQIRRDRAAKWNCEHPHRFKQNQRLYYSRNKERLQEKARIYAQAHQEQNKQRVYTFKLRNPWYESWQGARQRCTNPKHPRYKNYGKRGIKFKLSKQDMVFMWVRDKAAMMIRPGLDRINNDGDYVLENCHFMSASDNSKKKVFDAWKKNNAAHVTDN